jgi:hypothetical protein
VTPNAPVVTAGTAGSAVGSAPEPARPAGPPPVHVIETPANDDFPSRRAELAPWLLHADTCIPPRDALQRGHGNSGLPDDGALLLGLDVYDDHLVACTDVFTRRGNSVFFDRVSYGCWNVDATTGKLARRADLPRAYLDCRDGGCPAGDNAAWPSYDGHEVVVRDDDRRMFDVYARDAQGGRGKKLRSFKTPDDPVGEPASIAADLGGVVFVAVPEDKVVVVDERGRELHHDPGSFVHVLDATTARILANPLHAVDFDVVARRATAIALPGCVAGELGSPSDQRSAECSDALATTHLGDAVRLKGTLYAVADAGRRLLVVDAASYRATASRALAVCPPP